MPFDGKDFGRASLALAVLREARAALARPGSWCQHRESDAHGRRCAVGWLDYAARGVGITVPEVVVGYIAPVLPAPPRRVVDYNDERGRTQAEMVALFDAAITRAEGG